MVRNKKRLLKRIISFATITALCISLCVGCGNDKVTYYDQLTDDETSISLSWWGNDVRHEYTMDGVDVFQDLYENISVTYRYGEWNGYETRNKVWMESHTESDVMQINYSWLYEYSQDGEGYYDLYELTDYIDLSNYSAEDLELGVIDGKLNAISIAINTPVLYYNQDMLDAYGLDTPETWDDLFAAAKVLSEDGIYVLSMAEKHLFNLLIAYYEQSTGKTAFSDDGRFLMSQDDIEMLLEFYNRLIDEKVVMPLNKYQSSDFATGRSAGLMIWISDADNYCSALEEAGSTPVIGEFITIDGVLTGWYRKPATMYAISKNTDNPEAAATLLNYLVNSEEMAMYQQTEKGVPVSDAAVEVLEAEGLLDTYGYEATEKMNEHSDELGIMPAIMEYEEIYGTFMDGADAEYYGEVSLSEAAATIYDTIKAAGF